MVSVFLTLLSMIIPTCIHVAANNIILFFLMAKLYSIVYIYHIFFIYSSVDGHCFHLLAMSQQLLIPACVTWRTEYIFPFAFMTLDLRPWLLLDYYWQLCIILKLSPFNICLSIFYALHKSILCWFSLFTTSYFILWYFSSWVLYIMVHTLTEIFPHNLRL